jgi:hypothetical protein
LQFFAPVLRLDELEIKNIKIKLPFILNNEKLQDKGYIKFSLKNPLKINFLATIKGISSRCLEVEKIRIKNSNFNIKTSSFNFCFDSTSKNIPFKSVYINPELISYYLKDTTATAKIVSANCTIVMKASRFFCEASLDLQSAYFETSQGKISIYGWLGKATKIGLDFKISFLNVNLASVLQKFGYDKSLTGFYNIHINKLQIENNRLKELQGYIKETQGSKKKIFGDFIVLIAKNIFNVKIDSIKSQKTFNYLGIYFHYIKEKLIIKGLYYKNGNSMFTYNIDDFKERKTLLKSQGEKDCLIYGEGNNIINICSKGAVILSLDKLLKIRDFLFSRK